MEYDDIVYVVVLIIGIIFGIVFQNIGNHEKKKWLSTVAGLFLTLFVCRIHTVHPIIITFVLACVIKYHAISFALGFTYLIFFRCTQWIGIPAPTGHANMIQMIITLKLIGLAFEVRDNAIRLKKLKDGDELSEEDTYRKFSNPTIIDVFHYTFCYIGLLTGPYYTYRTYCDVFRFTRKEIKVCLKETLAILTYLPLLISYYLTASWLFPLQRLHTAEFYEESFLYKLWFMYPAFFIFRMRMYIAFKLSEATCTMSGLGMYPAETKPKVGVGPTTNYECLRLPTEKYNFETIRTINIYQCEFSYTVREATRHWNRSVQYWLATYVYHRFPYKNHRTAVTFFISSLWHGIHAGYYFSLFSVPFYLIVEDTFQKRVFKNQASKLIRILLWNAKMFQFSYWGLAFQLKNYVDIWNYGTSIYFMPYIVAIGMYLYAVSR